MKRMLTPELTKDVAARLSKANVETARLFPGDSASRQPVHTVYGGAHLFASDSVPKLGAAARAPERTAAEFSKLAPCDPLPRTRSEST
jgi:hypothetical protein